MLQENPHTAEIMINDKTSLQPVGTHQTESVFELDYQTIFEHSATAMAILEEDLTISRVNHEFIELFASSKEKLEGNKDWLGYVYQGDRALLSNYHQMRMRNPGSVPRNYDISITDDFGIARNIWLAVAVIPGTSRSVISLTDITRNKQLEKKSSYRIHLEAAVSKSSRLLISYGNDNIEEVLRLLGEAMSVDRTFIYQFCQAGKKMDNTYEWCAPKTSPKKDDSQNIDTALFPWWMKIIRTGQTYAIHDAQNIPLDSTLEWRTIKSWGVRSMLCVPISNTAGGIVGFIGFMTYKKNQPWLGEDANAMRSAAEMLVLYWERKKAEGLIRLPMNSMVENL